MREREGERGGGERDRQTDRDRDRETERQTDRDKDRETEKDRERQRQRQRQTDRQTETDRQAYRQTERDTHPHAHRQTVKSTDFFPSTPVSCVYRHRHDRAVEGTSTSFCWNLWKPQRGNYSTKAGNVSSVVSAACTRLSLALSLLAVIN